MAHVLLPRGRNRQFRPKELSSNNLSGSLSLGEDGVVPLAMELGGFELHGGELSVGHLDSGGVGTGVEGGADREAGAGGGGADELHDRLTADQRTSAPVLGDVAEHPVFDRVPLARAGREV